MRAFMVRIEESMADENDTEQDETDPQPQETSEAPPPMRLRDLRPEKDPMGARNGGV